MSTKHLENRPLHCSVLTISDTRTTDNDSGGKLIIDMLKHAGHIIEDYEIIKDEKLWIEEKVKSIATKKGLDVILLTGGTGIANRDVTIEAVKPLLDKEIPGFGELFRYLSFTEDIGTPAMLTRAIAGTYDHKAIFALPGSKGAITLALKKLIIPELAHVVYEIQKDIHNSM
ncbi:putative molybdopterin cofactor biosynthesis protein [Bacillus sp. TS-2]|nr:putative molybdopterin cofactor biosynthesis protein [Bacillus sp. TS-2]